jgi:hypothetical protein
MPSKITSKSSIVDNLREIYKLDLKVVLDKIVNKDNFIDYYALVHEIIESMKDQNQNHANEVLEANSEKILEFCLNRLALNLDRTKTNDLKLERTEDFDLNSWNLQHETVLINFMKLCSLNCSAKFSLILLEAFLVFVLKLIVLNKFDLHHIKKYDELRAELNLSENFFQTNESHDSSIATTLDLRKINFLINYFNLIASHNLKSLDFDKNTFNKLLIEYLIDAVLFLFHRANDNQNLSRLCINTLNKLAYISKSVRNLVLVKVFEKFSLNLKNENLYKFYLGTENANSNSQHQQMLNYSNENKKRLESFVQDLDLNLLASLGDHITESALESLTESNSENFINYLNKSEFWFLIQSCLAHTNSLSRKQALYLLKRSIDLAQVHRIEINSDYFDNFYSNEKKTENKVWLFQSEWSAWNDFFLCFELLEESSVRNFSFTL